VAEEPVEPAAEEPVEPAAEEPVEPAAAQPIEAAAPEPIEAAAEPVEPAAAQSIEGAAPEPVEPAPVHPSTPPARRDAPRTVPPEAAPQPRRMRPAWSPAPQTATAAAAEATAVRDPSPPRARGDRDWLAEARRLTTSDGDGGGRGPGREPKAPGGGGRRVARLMALGVLLIVAVGVLWFLTSLFQPFKGQGGERVRVQVPSGLGVGQIGDLLERRGIIKSSFFFSTRARLEGRSSSLKPGSYVMRKDMSYGAALTALEKGTPPNIAVVTVPEGRSRSEVAPLVKGKLRGSYVAATRHSSLLSPRQYGGRHAKNLEGFLFPATYQLKRGSSVTGLVDRQLAAFKQKIAGVNMSYARHKNLNVYDVLTIASLVEREAEVPSERPLIASVIYNRLKQGIPLGIDATVRFATGNWTRPLRMSELRSSSPYNTRRNSGLPPGPIGSPGLASIEAAAHPAHTKYLFYVVKPCGNGHHAFSATDAQFQRDVNRYNQARAKRGGKSPTSC
jgi:uncharacterized YceG family protein